MKISLLILLLFTYFYNCYSQEIEKDSLKSHIDSFNLDCYTQTIFYPNDTVYKEYCVERNASIYIVNRSYVFSGTILNSKLDTISSSQIILEGTNKRFEYAPKSQMTLNIILERFKDDSLLFDPVLNNTKCCDWLTKVESSVGENIEKCFIKPIRVNQFIATETVGFPWVVFPLKLDNQWSNEVSIGSYGWGDWCNKTIKSNYKIISKKAFKLKGKNISCWEVEVNSLFDGNKNKQTFLFNERYGFVLMQYEFYNGMKINFEMKECITK